MGCLQSRNERSQDPLHGPILHRRQDTKVICKKGLLKLAKVHHTNFVNFYLSPIF